MAIMESQRNLLEYSVSEISGAVKRTIEGAFGHVRVRGEISGFRGVHASGHCYFALKDEKARLEAVVWRSSLAKLKFKPEEGVEVIATGRVTTFPGQSKYQIVIEALEPAGIGALMALLEERRKKLAAEGLFAEERKRPLPYLPRVIGVVTSPTGSVIRDILHRLGDRFPTRVIVWPVRVQGETSAAEVAAAIRGFNVLAHDGPVARPDLLIVARGGGSLEDLWSFNEESVVRAAADSDIPLISAIGHETDVTLIDHAADRRAPTPSAAAEIAVPVRAELVARVEDSSHRMPAASIRLLEGLRRDFGGATRALPRPDDLLANERRTLDGLAGRIGLALLANAREHRTGYERAAVRLSIDGLARIVARLSETADALGARGDRAFKAALDQLRATGERAVAGLAPSRLHQALSRYRTTSEDLARRQFRGWTRLREQWRAELDKRGDLLEALSYRGVLNRGFALVTDDHQEPVRSVRQAPLGKALELRFHDGNVTAVSGGRQEHRPRKRKPGGDDPQGSLL